MKLVALALLALLSAGHRKQLCHPACERRRDDCKAMCGSFHDKIASCKDRCDRLSQQCHNKCGSRP